MLSISRTSSYKPIPDILNNLPLRGLGVVKILQIQGGYLIQKPPFIEDKSSIFISARVARRRKGVRGNYLGNSHPISSFLARGLVLLILLSPNDADRGEESPTFNGRGLGVSAPRLFLQMRKQARGKRGKRFSRLPPDAFFHYFSSSTSSPSPLPDVYSLFTLFFCLSTTKCFFIFLKFLADLCSSDILEVFERTGRDNSREKWHVYRQIRLANGSERLKRIASLC